MLERRPQVRTKRQALKIEKYDQAEISNYCINIINIYLIYNFCSIHKINCIQNIFEKCRDSLIDYILTVVKINISLNVIKVVIYIYLFVISKYLLIS